MHDDSLHAGIDRLIMEYVSGKLDKDSFDRLKRWSLESEDNRRYVRQRLEVWFSSGAVDNRVSFDKEKAYLRFLQRIHDRPESGTGRTRRLPLSYLYKVAAVILIVVLPIAGYWSGKETVKSTFADMVVEAPLGAQTRLSLPDGTSVWLNAGSKITYSQGFGMDDRKLSLEGEGYFEVEKNEKIPFEIMTPEVSLRVLGTKFNFRNYPDDKEVAVSLLEGSVMLHNEMKMMSDMVLRPDERMTLDKRTGEMRKSRADVENSMLWTRDELFFDEELLEDIAKKLTRSYDVRIEVADSLKGKRFYGSFRILGNTVEEVLEAIASTGQMRYKLINGKYILY